MFREVVPVQLRKLVYSRNYEHAIYGSSATAEGDSLKQSIIDGKGHNCATTQEGDNIKTGQKLVLKQSIFQSV